ncbi:unnamed protein product [Rotaria sp. Silwood1]|nr:unnamed protein product [Rotaria sp. Silwood1]CAF3505644.1 unnamed protein product [Rotaria sp. Silwood1]CAF4725488.1 unnamed protein product [Rotaria sp. Silwood1]
MVGQIVWARCNKDNIYWPGKITMISNTTNDFWVSELLDNAQQRYTYHIEFFITKQSIWTTDILNYRQYRDSMTNDSFIHYGLHPTIKQDFLNAINQADYGCSHDIYMNSNHLTSMTTMISQQQQQQQNFLSTIEDNTDNNFLLTSSPMFTSNIGHYNSSYQQTSTPSLNFTIQSLDTLTTDNSNINQMLTTSNDWHKEQGLLIESITPPLCSENDQQLDNISTSDNFQKQISVIIITSKTYTNSSFISYLFNCLSNIFHSSIIYIDDLRNYQHPNTHNIYYLICIDYFDSIIKQTLDLTILNNLNAHINYLFLIINAPSYEIIKHIYSIIIDKRTIFILHYHSTFDNEPLLLCSGNRTMFDMIRSTFLKYLCSKIKYIESNDNEQEQLYSAYCISSIIQSTNILNYFINEQIQETLNHKFESNFLKNNQQVINELFPQLSISKISNDNNLLELIHKSNEDILKNKSKQSIVINDLFQSRAIKTHIPPPICEYYVQNILNDK